MAKKKAPQRLAGAEESCISPEQEAIIQWFRTVKFRKNLLGGVDEAAMWKKLEELYALYEAAIRAERTRYNVLLETSPSKPDGFATSPSRGGLGMRFIFRSDRWRSKSIICRKAEITLRQQGKQERSARPRKRDGLPRAPLLGELSRRSP